MKNAGFGAGIIAVEPATAVNAQSVIAEQRMSGIPALVHFSIEEHMAALSRRVANVVASQTPDYDQRCDLLDALAAGTIEIGGQPARQFVSYSPQNVASMRLAARFANAIVVQTWSEYQRLVTLDIPIPRAVRFLGTDPDVPSARADNGDAVVVWAPNLLPEDLFLPAIALEELMAPLLIVCNRQAEFPGMRARFIASTDAAATLARARVIVDYTANPATAVSLARVGAPMAIPLTGGAYEYLDHATTFTYWDRRSISLAVQTAMARPAASLRDKIPDDPAILERLCDEERAKPVAEGPLVSIVIPTYNRPDLLATAIASAAAQTYKNIEIIVANDAGLPVESVVAKYPHAKVVNNPENSGQPATFNLGASNARGEYLFFLCDDDRILPDTIARLMAATTPGRIEFVNADAINECQDKVDGAYHTVGYLINSVMAMDRTNSLVYDSIGFGACLFPKRAWDELGGLDLSVPYSFDNDFLIRAHHYEFVHLDQPLYLRSVRYDGTMIGSTHSFDSASVYLDLCTRHPVDDRPILVAKRRQRLEAIRATTAASLPPRPVEEIPEAHAP